MTVKQAAVCLGISKQSVYALCAAGKLAHCRVGMKGGRVVIDERHVAAYKASCERGGVPDASKAKLLPYVPQCL